VDSNVKDSMGTKIEIIIKVFKKQPCSHYMNKVLNFRQTNHYCDYYLLYLDFHKIRKLKMSRAEHGIL
jgi:hypothetical protein